MFVAGFPGLVSVYQQWSVVTFSSVRTCSGLPLPCVLSVLSVSRIFFSKLLNPLLFHFISTNFVSSPREPYSLYGCKFLINVLITFALPMFNYQLALPSSVQMMVCYQGQRTKPSHALLSYFKAVV